MTAPYYVSYAYGDRYREFDTFEEALEFAKTRRGDGDVRPYTFRVPADGGRGIEVTARAGSLIGAAAKVSHRLGLPDGWCFAGWSRRGRWVRFQVGRSPRMVERVGRAG